MLNDFGGLTVRVQTAGAYPIEDAIVRVRGAQEGNSEIIFSLVTDNDGLTEKIRLPTPSPELSKYPDSKEDPYSLYDVEIAADGYAPKNLYGLTVFPEIDSLQIVGLIPEQIE